MSATVAPGSSSSMASTSRSRRSKPKPSACTLANRCFFLQFPPAGCAVASIDLPGARQDRRQAPASRAQHVQAASNGDAVQPTRARPSYSPRPPDSYLTLLRARRCWRTRWTREVSPAAAGGRSLPARRFGRSISFWESCSFIRVYTRLRLPAALDLGSALARSQAEAGGPNVLAPQFIRPNSSLCPQNRHEMNRDSVITVILTNSKAKEAACRAIVLREQATPFRDRSSIGPRTSPPIPSRSFSPRPLTSW